MKITMHDVAKNETASRIREMIGTYIRMWRNDKATDCDEHHKEQVTHMLKFASRVGVITHVSNSTLWMYVHKFCHERRGK